MIFCKSYPLGHIYLQLDHAHFTAVNFHHLPCKNKYGVLLLTEYQIHNCFFHIAVCYKVISEAAVCIPFSIVKYWYIISSSYVSLRGCSSTSYCIQIVLCYLCNEQLPKHLSYIKFQYSKHINFLHLLLLQFLFDLQIYYMNL